MCITEPRKHSRATLLRYQRREVTLPREVVSYLEAHEHGVEGLSVLLGMGVP